MIETRYLYRGVPANHPTYKVALQGRAVPGNPNGTVTPEEHNEGGKGADSPFISFTANYQIALRYAGSGGVILRFPTGASKHGDTWRWERSPDGFGEDEFYCTENAPVLRLKCYERNVA